MKLETLIVFLTLEFCVLRKNANAFEDADVEECLKDLNISELLRLKHSMERMEEEGSFDDNVWAEDIKNNTSKEKATVSTPKRDDGTCASQNCMKPMAMALTGMPRGYNGYGETHYSHHPWHPEEKPSKLTTLFNITITALAFLSFGGYLLCLIVHAIKSKGATFFYPVTTTATTGVDGIRKIKVYRRGRREITPEPWTTDYGEFYRSFGAAIMPFGSSQIF